MKAILIKLAIPAIFLTTVGNTGEELKKSRPELLVEHEWVLQTYGTDRNGDGVIGREEEMIQDCERDNSYVFGRNGGATYYDNAMHCGGPSEQTLSWALVNHDNSISLQFGNLDILQLSRTELILRTYNGMISVFRSYSSGE